MAIFVNLQSSNGRLSLSNGGTGAFHHMLVVAAVLILGILCQPTDAFAWGPSLSLNHRLSLAQQQSSSVLEMAKKKRRRKERLPPPGSAPSSSGELPDFELPEEASASPPKPKAPSNPDEITDAMMGSAMGGSVRSVKELIKDREIEKKFVFDDDSAIESTEQLPDLPGIPKPNKKAARKQAAIEREAAKEQEINFEAPGFLKNEKGEVTPLKVSW